LGAGSRKEESRHRIEPGARNEKRKITKQENRKKGTGGEGEKIVRFGFWGRDIEGKKDCL
jgi:hypothetical protein